MIALNEPAVQRVDKVWQRFIDQRRIVGGVLLLARQGRLVYASALGWADREQQIPVTRSTRFRLASLTKLLTSVVVLRLCEQGILDLKTSVTDWLPAFRPRLVSGREPVITLQHLLSHTCGLSYGFEQTPGNAYERAGVSDGLDWVPFDLPENLTRLARLPLLFEPGSAWGYSLGTDVLGAVIEQATGMPLSEAVAKWVTLPLRMDATSFRHDQQLTLASAYKDSVNGPQRIGDNDVLLLDSGQARLSSARARDAGAYESGGAGMLGTADDYLRLLECLRLGGAPLLSAVSTERLLNNAIGSITIASRGPGWKFGLGPMILADPAAVRGQQQGVGTWSWCGLYGSHYWVDPVSALSMVVLTNTAVAGAWGEFADTLVDALYARPEVTPGQTACDSCSG
ncbi:s C beta-lactamase [Pseudomonas savastanoi pv. glycinea]|uniref:serine hydrolase domain-containing protein n=1 Tax=Pseudomonas savastanoi TaxID=29438 RepID=UPI0001F70901|nr:serine hydrolase domain-containing protein [Pseudomonas savastanoi]KPB86133.1 Beta-lactamase [Pseudomonas syringae pv. maculicola]EFW84483.1 beta-lactamase [Pseudomonas savastanoi pv. glycinea str. race 4]KPB43017.1 Beta-lactamase [Pseudomonas savastanoi pv. phaseolicola]MBN3470294.1 beta-lactamase family protein [Pseudomonas savastanoi pv. phaseolicola]MBN3477319.1 beta-lactamase family protein [Pseudomonas savastanoi pv. phaseolicola]